MTAAGTFRHPVTIEKNQPTTDASRQRVDNWVKHCSRRAAMRQLFATERYEPQANNEALITHEITLRFDSKTLQINEGDRVKFQPQLDASPRYFAIQTAVDAEGLRRYIQIQAIERKFER